jgi:TonB family protein
MNRVALVVVWWALAASGLAGQEDPLRTARDLYASAAYEEALTELAKVRSGGAAAPDTDRASDAYRAFCLVALGRTREAEAVAETLLRKDPMMIVDLRDASPRIEEMFASVRKRVLPQLIRDTYRSARASAIDKAPDAAAQLTHVKDMLAEAEKIGVWDDTLADLRVLVDGFLDLSRAGAQTPSPAAVPAVPAANAEPSGLAPVAPRIYAAADAGVVAPVALSQPPPHVPGTLLDLVRRLRRVGALDIVIDERGSVAEVVVRQSVNTAYDTLIAAAARSWKYRPATKDGVPVKFAKTVLFDARAE